MSFDGYCEKICNGLNIQPMVDWITAIPFEEWPQQHPPHFKALKPAMINDTGWHGFGKVGMDFIHSGFNDTPVHGRVYHNLMLSVVMPFDFIASHQDDQPQNWDFRVHVPLVTNPACCIFMDHAYYMKPGCAYRLNTRRHHAIVNHGDTPRIHFMFDIIT